MTTTTAEIDREQARLAFVANRLHTNAAEHMLYALGAPLTPAAINHITETLPPTATIATGCRHGLDEIEDTENGTEHLHYLYCEDEENWSEDVDWLIRYAADWQAALQAPTDEENRPYWCPRFALVDVDNNTDAVEQDGNHAARVYMDRLLNRVIIERAGQMPYTDITITVWDTGRHLILTVNILGWGTTDTYALGRLDWTNWTEEDDYPTLLG